VGNRQPRLVDLLVAEEQQIEVDRPRPVPRPLATNAPESRFDRQEAVEQRTRLKVGLDGGGTVQEGRLVLVPDGLRLAQRRDCDDVDSRLAAQQIEGGGDARIALAEICSDADVRPNPRDTGTT
jgi:hypothetical protein